MLRFAALSALCCAALVLAGCERQEVERRSDEATRYFSLLKDGVEHDLRLLPAGASAGGPLVVTRARLTWGDGAQIPLSQVGAGVFRTPSLRSRHGARASRICGGQPVAYLALHRGPGDFYYLNAGNWATAPTLPGHETQAIPGACETSAYVLDRTGA